MASVTINPRRLRDAKARSIKRQRQAGPPQPLLGIAPDPLGQLRSLLTNGMEPAEALAMVCTSGLQSLIGGPAPRDAARDLQTAFSLQLAGDAAAPRSAARLHRHLDGWIAAAQTLLADPENHLHLGRAVVICRDDAERQQVEALLRQPPEGDAWGDGDPIAAAQELAVDLYGADPARLPRLVLTVDEIQEGQSWCEVFLSPGCQELEREQLLRVLQACRVGLHVVMSGTRIPLARVVNELQSL